MPRFLLLLFLGIRRKIPYPNQTLLLPNLGRRLTLRLADKLLIVVYIYVHTLVHMASGRSVQAHSGAG